MSVPSIQKLASLFLGAVGSSVSGTGDQVGLFIRAPAHIAVQFSDKPEDTSPPHVTLLYVGEVDKDQEPLFIETLRKALSAEPAPIRATLQGVDSFKQPAKGLEVFYTKVKFSRDLGGLKDLLISRLSDAGFKIQDSFPLAYNPHMTLEYAPANTPFTGEVPTGYWDFSEIEVWGLPTVYRIPFGSFYPKELPPTPISKSACIVAVGQWGGRKCLLKNRDRNYVPKVRIVHTLLDGVEVAYMEDVGTGWIEGLNGEGIGIVNSALMVGRDEKEKELVETTGKKSKDGSRVLEALSKTTLAQALKSLTTFDGGVKGHTLVSDANKTFSLEQTSKHEAVTAAVPDQDLVVRTNHGFAYPDAGYTEGVSYLSSVNRLSEAYLALSGALSSTDLGPSLMRHRHDDRHDPLNVVRDTEGMSTTSQLVLDLTKKVFHFYALDGKVEFLGIEETLPQGYTPKIQIKAYRYDDDHSWATPLSGFESSVVRLATSYLISRSW